MLMDLPVVPSPSPSLQSIKSPDIRFRPYDITKPNKSQTPTPSEAHRSALTVSSFLFSLLAYKCITIIIITIPILLIYRLVLMYLVMEVQFVS